MLPGVSLNASCIGENDLESVSLDKDNLKAHHAGARYPRDLLLLPRACTFTGKSESANQLLIDRLVFAHVFKHLGEQHQRVIPFLLCMEYRFGVSRFVRSDC
eukprot:761063-Hanusia_phi.AAC.1